MAVAELLDLDQIRLLRRQRWHAYGSPDDFTAAAAERAREVIGEDWERRLAEDTSCSRGVSDALEDVLCYQAPDAGE